MRYKFDGVLEENKRLFKEEQKLESTAKRLREELDGLLELCLDLNQSPSISPELRFNISRPRHQSSSTAPDVVPANITPEQAHDLLREYELAVRNGQIPQLDLHVIRQQIDTKLAAQDVLSLEDLEAMVPHPIAGALALASEEPNPSFMTTEHETEYLARLDAKLPLDPYTMAAQGDAAPMEEKHWAELTPRELERQVELLNPQSQHNWLKTHSKANTNLLGDNEDTESLASHDTKPARRRGGKDKNLAKQVGDRAVERAREGEPSAAGSDEEAPPAGHGKKRSVRDPDGAYRLKGSKSATGPSTGAKGAKRKRSAVEDAGVGSSAGKKRVKVEEDGDGEEDGGV